MSLRFVRRYPFSVLCVLAIWLLCLVKPQDLPQGPDISGLDKVAHFVMYFGLCSLLWLEHLRINEQIRWQRFLIWGVVAPILMSGIIELAQAYLTTSRSGDWADFVANSLGVLVALPWGYYVLRPLVIWWQHR